MASEIEGDLEDLKIVLQGVSGARKSSVVIAILGREAFKESRNRESEIQRGRVEDRNISIIDAPGLFNTHLTDEELQDQMMKSLDLCDPSPYVFQLVFNLETFEEDERNIVEEIEKIFGVQALKFTIMLFTGREGMAKKKWKEFKLSEKFQDLISKCKAQLHAINHTSEVIQTQIKSLLKEIHEFIKQNDEQHLNNKLNSLDRSLSQKKQQTTEQKAGSSERIVLLGTTVGKSATGNTILGREKSNESVTEESQRQTCDINGQCVTVINRGREEEMKKLEEEKERMKMTVEEGRQNQDKERKRREEEFNEREERYKGEMKEQEQMRDEMRREREMLKDEMKQEKETAKKEKENQQIEIDRLMNRIENEREHQDKERKRREEEFNEREERYKREMKEQKEQMRDEMKQEREMFKDEMKQEKETAKKEKENLYIEIDRLMNRIENEREHHDNERKRKEEEFNEREERYKREMKEQREQMRDEMKQEREMLKDEMKQEKETAKKEKENLHIEIDRLMNRIENERQHHDNERKRREEEFNEREERYKTQMKEKEENGEKICEEIKREREKWEKEKLEEKTRKEEEGKKRREKEQRNCDEFIHRLKEEREDLQSKHEKEINKMKIVMEEMNREREKLMKKEKERMKMMMEEQQNQEKQRREEEFREREKYKREMKEQEEQMRDKMKRIKEMSKELETVKKENYIEIDRLMNRIENERRHHDERKRREEEFNEREERYKREMKEKEREIHELKTVMEKGQKNIIILLSADNNDQKTSNENTSSETIRKHHSNGKSLNVAHNIKNNWSKKIEGGDNEHLPMFKVNLNETWQSRDGFCRRRLFGKNNTKENKTIMMIGATGAGKTTLINSMINYILGVQWEDDFRFVLIDEGKQKSQAESQTSEITAYQINHMNGFRIPYSLTIVDTPGFGDTRGISQDQKITKQIQELFSAPGGIDCINAVCFVVQASLARLTHTQRYIFDSILSIFGKDIAQNIIVLVTFADGKTPPVLEAIKVSEVPCSTDESGEPLHFKFNNSAVFATNNKSADDEESDCENFDQMFWKLGFSSMKKFFTSLNTMKTQSLCLTQEVLKERQQLEVFLEGLQPQISAGLTKLGEIKKTRAALEQHKAEMDANKDFEYELEVTVPKQIENTTGNYLTNCQTCHFTCHDKCIYANDSDKYKCSAMKDGKCRVCPGKCVWNVHFNQKYKWDYVKEKRKETYQELKKRYEDAHGQVMSKEKIFEELEKEFHVVQGIVAKLIKGSQMSLERLQDIALKPNPLSTPDYIDLMIESEKQEAKPGFHDRIQSLMEVRKKAEIISKVSTGEVLSDDWKAYKTVIRRKEPSYDPRVLFNHFKHFIQKK